MASSLHDASRISALRRTGLLDSPPEESFDRLTRIARRLLDAPVALISLVDTDRQFFKSQQGLPEPWASRRQTPLTHSFCRHVIADGKPLVVENAREHPLVQDNPAISELDVVAYLGVPLVTPDGQALGSLCVIDDKPRAWGNADLQTLRDLAALVMSEIALRLEVTERRKAEQTQQLLIRELHHRVKNTLATVQAIIHLTMRSSSDMETFQRNIDARIASLAKTHTLLADQRWDTTSLKELLGSELVAFQRNERITLNGPDVRLSSDAAVPLGMVVHELTTNASKYGALSNPTGQVAVTWSVAPVDSGPQLDLVWVEHGGPAVTPPDRRGFGKTLIERLAKGALKGNAKFDYRPEGLQVHLTAALPERRADAP